MKKVFKISELAPGGRWVEKWEEWESYDQAERFVKTYPPGRYKIEEVIIVSPIYSNHYNHENK